MLFIDIAIPAPANIERKYEDKLKKRVRGNQKDAGQNTNEMVNEKVPELQLLPFTGQ